MNVQQRYNGVFDDITISEEKRKEIEAAMRETTVVKKKIGLKKYAVIAVSLVMVLSMGIIVNAATDGELLNKIANVIGITIDGEKVDVDDYVDENGNIDYENLIPNSGLIIEQYDDNGNVNVIVESTDDPRNDVAWHFIVEDNKRFLVIPEKAELTDDTEVIVKDGEKCIDVSEADEALPITIPFTYSGEIYTVVVHKDIELGEFFAAIYEGMTLEYHKLPSEMLEE